MSISLELKRATIGKPGMLVLGPNRTFLKFELKLGEVAVCIANEGSSKSNPQAYPSIWVRGPILKVEKYVSQAKEQGGINEEDYTLVMKNIQSFKKKNPSSIERLSMTSGIEVEDLLKICELAQVHISAPLQGVMNYSSGAPKWIEKTQG